MSGPITADADVTDAGPGMAHIQLHPAAALHQPFHFVARLDQITGGIRHRRFQFVQAHSQQLMPVGAFFAQQQRGAVVHDQLKLQVLLGFSLAATAHVSGQKAPVFHHRPQLAQGRVVIAIVGIGPTQRFFDELGDVQAG